MNTEFKKIALQKSMYYELTHNNGLENKYLSNIAMAKLSNLKSDNLQYNTLSHWVDGTIISLTDVPGIIFYYNFLQNSLQKSFQLFF